MKKPLNLLCCAVLAIGAMAVTACSDGDSGSSGGGEKKSASVTPPASGCGSFTAQPAKDPDGVVKDINNDGYTKGLAGYPAPIRSSTWSDWKPKGEPPYTVGVSWNQLTAPFQIGATDGIKDTLNKSPLVDKVIFSTTGADTDVGKQLQQMNGLLRQKPDIILLEPLTAPSFAKQIKQAAGASIPVLLALDSFDSPDAVNIGANNTLGALTVGSQILRLMGGKGTLLKVGAIPGSTPDVNTDDALEELLSNCPDVKMVGNLTGLYTPSLAKAETLKYLGTNPAQIDGVYQTATMASGVMQAFEQAGRDIPPTSDVGGTKGSLGYWRQNQDTYTGAGTGLGGIDYGTGMANVALRMLDGQGLKTNAVIETLPFFGDDNLDEWAEPDWDLNTPGTAEGPGGVFLQDPFLDLLFNNPKALSQK